MSDEQQVVNPTESTPVETVVNPAEATTVEKVVEQPKAEPTVPYDRFQEVIKEKQYYQELVQQLASRQGQGETPKQVENDPYAGMDAETAQFYRNLDKRTQGLIQQEAQKLAEPMKRQLENQALQVSKILEQQFRQQNKDVEPNSAEEKEIASYIRMGVPIDKATMAVMGNKRLASAQNQKVQIQQVKTQQKANANLETSSILSHSVMPESKKLSFKENFEKRAAEFGLT